LEVRRIEPADWPALRELRLRALADAPGAFALRLEDTERRPDELWQEWAQSGSAGDETATFFAVEGQRLLGMAGGFFHEAERRATVFAMWVAPEARRGGTGRALLHAVEAWASAAGAESTDLSVTDVNPDALSFYRACGYVETGWTAPLERDPTITQIGMRKDRLASGAFAPDVDKWDAWDPQEVQRRLARVEAPWCVAAGWALDLFLGEQRREHEDIEIAVPHHRFGEVAEALAHFELFVVGAGHAWPLAQAGEIFDTYHQTWVREPASGLWRVDVFREPAEGETWICRRDQSIRMPYDRVIERTPDGIPYLRPELVLFFKAKHVRPRDDEDFAAVVPRLQPERRRWLADALSRVYSDHRWLAALP
jgi:GNAT superfamily N-acetyltransferase